MDIKEVQKLVLTNPECKVPNFTKAPWCDATLITPRNTVKDLWNSAALERHCRMTGNQKYMAEDTLIETGSKPDQRTRLAVASLKDEVMKNLKRRVELSVGMKAMVVLNIVTEADVANGTCGTVHGIALDPREGCVSPDEEGCIHLQYPPPIIYFKPDMETQIIFEGVPRASYPSHHQRSALVCAWRGGRSNWREGKLPSFLDTHSQITRHRDRRVEYTSLSRLYISYHFLLSFIL